MDRDPSEAFAGFLDSSTREEALAAIYPEMRRLAVRALQRERRTHTVQPTSLVNEVIMKLLEPQAERIQDKAHFYAVASLMMRRVLIDHARQQMALKRRSGLKVSLDEAENIQTDPDLAALAVDEALNSLQEIDARAAKVIEMRFFGGFTDEEIGELLGVSFRTVRRDYQFARAWLQKRLASQTQ
jgi:RNA polymerase sigma-70 factor, ECF subfamily